jgi:hypothetical protein
MEKPTKCPHTVTETHQIPFSSFQRESQTYSQKPKGKKSGNSTALGWKEQNRNGCDQNTMIPSPCKAGLSREADALVKPEV